MHDLNSFFESIKFVPESNVFANVSIKKVVLNKKEEVFNVYLHSSEVLPIDDVDALLSSSKNKINGEYKCNIIMDYDEIKNEET